MKTLTAVISMLAAASTVGVWLVSSIGGVDADVPPADSGLSVSTLTLEPIRTISQKREFTGTIIAARRTRLAFERSARLISVNVDDGQKVVQGQVLATIDQRQLETQVSELAAQLRQQQAVLAELNAGPRKETIAAAKAEHAALVADVELRKATFDRTQSLFDRRATSSQALDEARLAWKSAAAGRDAAGKRLDELLAGTRTERIDAQQAVVAGMQSRLDRLRVEQVDSQLKAPFAGTIVNRLNDEGDMINAQQPLFEILESGALEARVGVPSRFMPALRKKDYHILAANDLEFVGSIRNVIAQVDAATRTQAVVLELNDPQPENIVDGQLVRLQFEETVPTEGFRIPVTAMSYGSRGLWTVYAVEAADEGGSSVLRSRAVEVLHTDGEFAVIRGAVYSGETIVANGLHRVTPGQRVSVVSSTAEKE